MLSMIAIALVMTSCKKDDTVEIPAAQEVAGTYTGKTVLNMTGQTAPGAPSDAEIKIEQSGVNVKMTLVKSAFDEILEGEKISVDNIVVTKADGKITLAGAGKIEMDESTSIDIKITGTSTGNALELKIVVPLVPNVMEVTVDFTGAKVK